MLAVDALYKNFTHRIKTPDGTAIISIVYSKPGVIEHLEMNIGKAGSAVAAWCNAFSRMTFLALQSTSLDEVIDLLSDIATDRVVYADGVTCRSGPEAMAIALRNYRSKL